MAVQIEVLTYGNAIAEIARLVGHPVPLDPVGSTDPAVLQMGAAVNVALTELLTLHEWQDLTLRMSISIVASAPGEKERAFDLPADYYRFIDQTQWSPQTMLPAMGPISPQAWMQYTVQNWTPQLTLFWQVRGDKLNVLNPPFPTPVDFQAFYISKAQVIDQDDPTLLKNRATKNGDTFMLDSFMIMQLGRARYLEWKGFDASAATRDFLVIYNSRAGADKGSSVLSLNRPAGFPLLSTLNVPITGYGS